MLEQVTTTRVVDVIQEMASGKAAAVVEQLSTQKATEVVQEMASAKAADVVQEMVPQKAAEVIEQVNTTKAADVVQHMVPEKAAAVVERTTPQKAGQVLEAVPPDKAGQVMQQMATDKLTTVVPNMTETALTQRLPEMTVEKLYEIPPRVLFDALPNAPTEALVAETPPAPPAGLPGPVQVYTTPSGARYLAIRTVSGEWAVLMGSPFPIHKIMVKFREGLANIQTDAQELPARPADVPSDPPGVLAGKLFTITLVQGQTQQPLRPQDILAAHLTYKVEKAWMKNKSIHKWSIQLYVFDTNKKAWVSMAGKQVNEDANYLYYSAVLPHFSLFAITGQAQPPPPRMAISDLLIAPSQLPLGGKVDISATIANLSTQAETFVVPLWINSVVETSQTIILAPGARGSLQFSVSRQAPGAYQVRIDREMGSFVVGAVVPSGGRLPGSGAWLLAMVVGLMAMVLGLYALRGGDA